ncbi:MAG: S8 family serine peptidase [Candidatus Methylacidiphilales bacterium]
MITKNTQRTYLFIAFGLLFSNVNAQKKAPENWFNLDYKENKVYGVSTEKAYNELLKGKKSKTIIVAVIDGGTEVAHKDLKEVIWQNPGELAGNGIDDDKNGYIDDVNGWSFIGGKDTNVVEDNLEITRVYNKYNKKFEGVNESNVSVTDKEAFFMYKKAEAIFVEKYENATRMFNVYNKIEEGILKLKKTLGTDKPTVNQIEAYKATAKEKLDVIAATSVLSTIKKGGSITDLLDELNGGKSYFKTQLDFQLSKDFDSRKLVGDNYDDITERYYGSNYVSGPKGDHGTHVAGIIAAVRNNNLGMNGISDNVKIMVLRVVPDGDERDKDIANAIRYAADNGAKIINMSFGKALSPNKRQVDEAVKYAISKDVLLIHAAGNDNHNIDTIENYPNVRYYNSNQKASAWIEVGASTWKKKKYLTANFSNYGKQTVDVFAPGFDIYSCIPVSEYASFNGTSMAAPVVAGVAATLRSYFPEITAEQTKELILESSIKYNKKVFIPGTKTKVLLSDICVSGGIANLYEAIKLGIAKGYKLSN